MHKVCSAIRLLLQLHSSALVSFADAERFIFTVSDILALKETDAIMFGLHACGLGYYMLVITNGMKSITWDEQYRISFHYSNCG